MSWEQMETLCEYLEVSDPTVFHEALIQFSHDLWAGKPSGRVMLEEQTEKMTSIPLDYDEVEVVAALRNAVSSMDIARGALERAHRIIRHPSCGSTPYEFLRDAGMAARASLLLAASIGVAQRVLESTPITIPDSDDVPSNVSDFDDGITVEGLREGESLGVSVSVSANGDSGETSANDDNGESIVSLSSATVRDCCPDCSAATGDLIPKTDPSNEQVLVLFFCTECDTKWERLVTFDVRFGPQIVAEVDG